MKLSKTYHFLEDDLNKIESILLNKVQANHPVLTKASKQLLEAGGKRIRPIFVLLSGRLGTNHFERLIKVAVSLELIHMATLVHDDVVDDATLRRGSPTVKHQYDNRVAMYTGDYILARAIENISSIKDPIIHQVLSKTLVEVCVGEIEQIKDQFNWNQSLRNYLRRIKRKTALLIATSCQLGAIAGGTTYKQAKTLFQFGYYTGMSFQIIDDVLDFISSEDILGKPVASDLLQGNITLPVLYAMEEPYFQKQINKTFKNPDHINQEQFKELLSALHETNAIERSYRLSDLYLEKAMQTLNKLPHSKTKQSLEEIATNIGDRRF